MEKYHRTRNGLTKRDFTFVNPFDLAPVTDVFAAVVEEEIVKLKPDQPLVILAGETHTYPVDIASHICNLDYLHRKQQENPDDPKRRFIFAEEAPFNAYEDTARCLRVRVPSYLRYHPEDIDPDNRITIGTRSLSPSTLYATETCKLLYRFLHQHSITVAFNDMAARDTLFDGYYLCQKDPLFAQALDRFYQISREKTHAIEPDKIPYAKSIAMAMRNIGMAERALAKAIETHSRIIYQRTGSVHTLGDFKGEPDDRRCFLREAQATLYREAGARVLCIIDSDQNLRAKDGLAAMKQFPNTLIKRNLDRKHHLFVRPSLFDKVNEVEVGYLERLVENYSGEACPFSTEQLAAAPDKAELRSALKANIAKHKRPNFFQRLFLGS